MLYCCWKGNNVDRWEVWRSVEAPNLEVAMSHFLIGDLVQPPIKKSFKGTRYAKFPGKKDYWLVFEDGKGPSLRRLKGLVT